MKKDRIIGRESTVNSLRQINIDRNIYEDSSSGCLGTFKAEFYPEVKYIYYKCLERVWKQ